MRALVGQDAAALAAPGGAPVAGIVVVLGAVPVGDDPVDTADLAKVAGLNQVLDLDVRVTGALVQHDALHKLRMLGALRKKTLRVSLVDAQGLLDVEVHPVVHGHDRQVGMLEVGNLNHHKVDAGLLEKLLVRGELLDLVADVRIDAVKRLGIQVTHGNQFGGGNLVHPVHDAGTHVANANDTYLYTIHQNASFCLVELMMQLVYCQHVITFQEPGGPGIHGSLSRNKA